MLAVVAVGAHPDDIELGCGGTLALHKMCGHKVYLLVLTSGEASGDPSIREEECRKSADILRADGLVFGGLQDTFVHDGRETINIIEDLILKTEPDVIYCPAIKDTHQDHRNAGLASLAAGRRCKRILLYEGASTQRDFCPQVFVDIDKTFEVKLKAVSSFGSQLINGGSYSRATKSVEGLAKVRGFQAGLNLAEAFEVGKFMLEYMFQQR
jgi:LmbE family N-acetylglucosaminyl deacetylase